MELTPWYYKAYGLVIASELPLPPLQPVNPGVADLVIRRGQLPEAPPFGETKIVRANLNARFAQRGSNQLWLDWSPLISFMAVNGTELVVETSLTDEDLVSLFTLSEALGLILFQKGYFLLHGSAVRLGAGAVLFLGEPGAGKSTTIAAFAQKGCPVISDDMVCILPRSPGQHLIIPAFPQIKLWKSSADGLRLPKETMVPVRDGVDKFSWHDAHLFEDQPVPLKQIYVLLPPNGPGVQIEPVPISQIPVELLHHFPLADALLIGKPLKEYFEKSVVIAQRTPLSQVRRPANFALLIDFVEQLKATHNHAVGSLT